MPRVADNQAMDRVPTRKPSYLELPAGCAFSRISRWQRQCVSGLLLLSLLLLSQQTLAATLGFSLDNDFFVGKDNHYTNGVRLAWLSSPRDTGQAGCAYATGLCGLPGMSGVHHHQAWSLAFQQMMITPKDITQRQPDYTDLPYVGFSQLDLGFYDWSERVLTGYGVRLGIIGKNSGAGAAQRAIHHLIGSKQPEGWDHQLGPATVGGVYAFQARQLVAQALKGGYGWSSHLVYGVDANNFIASARLGGFVSYGHQRIMRFIPDFTGLATSAAMVGHNSSGKSSGWSVFAGLLGEYDGYNYADRHAPAAYHLSARKTIGNLLLGAAWHHAGLQLVFTLRSSNSTLKHDDDPLTFGDLTLLWKLP